jgi:hypothetical protein
MHTRHVQQIVLAVVALAAFSTARAAAQSPQPALATLQGAALTAGEVGSGFSAVSSGPSADNLAYTVTYAGGSTSAPSVIGITLRLDATSSTQTVAQGAITVLQQIGFITNVQATAETPPNLGTDAVAYAISGLEDNAMATGGVVVWQQGPVLVLVFGAGVDLDPGILALAQQQGEKLAAALGS